MPTQSLCFGSGPTCAADHIVFGLLVLPQHVGIYALLHVISHSPLDKIQSRGLCISWPFRDIVLKLTVVGHSLSLVRWRSRLCQMICETPLSGCQHS